MRLRIKIACVTAIVFLVFNTKSTKLGAAELLLGVYQDTILRFNATSGTSNGSYSVGGWLQRLALGPDGYLYMSHDGHAGASGNGWIDRLDPTTGMLIDTFISGLHGPYDMVWVGNELLVANRGTNDILRFNASTGEFLGEFISTDGSYDLNSFARGPDGNFYLGFDSTDNIRKYDSSGNALGVFASGGGLDGPNAVLFGPNGDLYVASGRTNQVLRFDGVSGEFLNALPSGPLSAPIALAFGPDGHLYVSNHDAPNSRVTRLNGQTGQFIDDFVPAGTPGLISATGLLFYPPFVPEPTNEPPDCTNAAPSVTTIWPPNHKFVSVNVVGATDPDGDPVTITIDAIFQDEPVDSNGNGQHVPDGMGVATNTAQVRAERLGNGNGRVYHIFYTADDGNGGTCSGEVKVCVPHDQGQGANCVDGGAMYNSTVSQ